MKMKVVGMGHQLEVDRPIMSLVQINMMYIVSFRNRTDKSHVDKRMN